MWKLSHHVPPHFSPTPVHLYFFLFLPTLAASWKGHHRHPIRTPCHRRDPAIQTFEKPLKKTTHWNITENASRHANTTRASRFNYFKINGVSHEEVRLGAIVHDIKKQVQVLRVLGEISLRVCFVSEKVLKGERLTIRCSSGSSSGAEPSASRLRQNVGVWSGSVPRLIKPILWGAPFQMTVRKTSRNAVLPGHKHSNRATEVVP